MFGAVAIALLPAHFLDGQIKNGSRSSEHGQSAGKNAEKPTKASGNHANKKYMYIYAKEVMP
jgi:hypothetical protein